MNGISTVSEVIWVTGNVVMGYNAIAVVVFALGYYILFDPSATTAGKALFRFMMSLVGLVSLTTFSLFFFPITDHPWYEMPPEVDQWWPWVRLGIYGYVAFTITSMATLLVLRKWFPKTIKSAPTKHLVRVRHDTEAIDIIHPKELP